MLVEMVIVVVVLNLWDQKKKKMEFGGVVFFYV